MPPNVRPGRGSVRVEREVAEALLNFETISGTGRGGKAKDIGRRSISKA